MYCYFKGEVEYCCDSCDNCEHYSDDYCEEKINNDDINEEGSTIDYELKSNIIISAKYTYEVDEFNYSKLICVFADGAEKIFNFCADNPMPKEYVVQDLTWEQLQGLCMGMWRMAIGEFIKVNK